MSNYVQVSVADPFGNLLAQVEPELSEISWLLNDAGAVKLTMRTTDPKWRQDYFRLGGMLLLEFDNGLPAWAGLSTGSPRVQWRPGKLATVAYESAEKFPIRRRTGKNTSFANQTVADIVASLLDEMNGKRKSILRAGDLWTTSPTIRREYHYENLLGVLRKLSQDTGGDWGITGGRGTGLNTNRLDLLLNFWARRGLDKPDVAFIEDHNAIVVDYAEQDAGLINDMVVVGAGNNWLPGRIEGVYDNPTSINTYDLWESAAIENNITSLDTLTTIAQARVNASLAPYKVLTLDVVDLAPAAFASYHIGDSVSVSAHSVGWGGVSGLGRITARTFNPNTGLCRVILELV